MTHSRSVVDAFTRSKPPGADRSCVQLFDSDGDGNIETAEFGELIK